MTTRAPFQGLPEAASRALLDRLDRLEAEVRALRSVTPSSRVVTGDLVTVPGDDVVLEPPPAGLALTLPEPTLANRGTQVTALQRNDSPVRVSSVRGLVNRQALYTSSATGLLVFESDGRQGWFSTGGAAGAPGAPGAPGETTPPGLAFPADDDGPAWLIGPPGLTGAIGPTGPTGPAGGGGSGASDGPGLVFSAEDALDLGSVSAPFQWSDVLAAGNQSGPNNAFVAVGQHINFGLAGPTASNPQIRSGDATFRVRGGGVISVGSAASLSLFAETGNASLAADAGAVVLQTALANRVVIASTGEWTTPAGSSGQVLTHQGAGVSPVWATPSGGGGGSSVAQGLVLDPTEALNLVRASGTWDAVTSHVESDNTLGSTQLTGVVVTTALSTAGGALDRTIVDCNIYCVSAGTISVTAAGATVIGPLALLAGERVEFTSEMGWRVFHAIGAEKQTPGATGPAGPAGSNPAPAGIVLSATNHSLDLAITSGTYDTHTSFVDQLGTALTPGSQQSDALAATGAIASAPAASTQRTVDLATIVAITAGTCEVRKNVGGVLTTLVPAQALAIGERIEFTGLEGWRVFNTNGSERAPGQVTVSPGQQLGRQIDAAGSAVASPLSGAEQGENWRWATGTTDTTTSGDLGATSYQIEEPDNLRQFVAPSPAIIHGLAFTGPGGGAAVAADGRPVLLRVRATSAPVIFRHESGTEASTARRMQMPGHSDFVALPRDMMLAWDDPQGSRRMILPFSMPGGSDSCELRDEFIGGASNPDAGDLGGWRTIAGGTLTQRVGEANHPGIIGCTVVAGSHIYGCLGGIGTVGSTGNGSIFAEDVDFVEFIIRPTLDVTLVKYFVGLSSSPDTQDQNTVDCVGASFSTASADAGWMLQSRSGGASTRNGTGVALSVSTWYRVRLLRYASGWALKVNNDGNLVLNTTNIPTGRMYPTFHVHAIAGGGSRGLDADFFMLRSAPLTRF